MRGVKASGAARAKLEDFVAITPNTISFEKQPVLKEKFIELFSLSTGSNNASERIAEFLCCLPKAVVPEGITYENVFRVAIVQFMDRFNFDLGGVKLSCVHFVEPDGKIYPFDVCLHPLGANHNVEVYYAESLAISRDHPNAPSRPTMPMPKPLSSTSGKHRHATAVSGK